MKEKKRRQRKQAESRDSTGKEVTGYRRGRRKEDSEQRGRSGRPVEEISQASEVSGGQPREGAILTDGDQLTLKECREIKGLAGDQRQNIKTAGKDSSRDADLVSMLGFADGNWDIDTVHDSAGKIIRNQACPDFLNDGIGLEGMEFSKANGIFEGTERSFDTPAAEVEILEFFEREGIGGKVGDK